MFDLISYVRTVKVCLINATKNTTVGKVCRNVRTVLLYGDGVIDEKGVKSMTQKYSLRRKEAAKFKKIKMPNDFHLSRQKIVTAIDRSIRPTRHSRSLLEPRETIRERHHTQITRVVLPLLI